MSGGGDVPEWRVADGHPPSFNRRQVTEIVVETVSNARKKVTTQQQELRRPRGVPRNRTFKDRFSDPQFK